MSEQGTNKAKWNMHAALQHIYFNEIMFAGLVLLCFFGEVLMEVSDRAGVFYWLLMSPVFFFATLLSEKTKAMATDHKTEHLIN
ncbi:hypothetical protein [Bathymodiolus japonicus methanotrophic gill symbiont]|uniref:hypothetical protein n=1 Tax=Bathymodiolus japonicus methanotrophic gill symbiont TaxID=113269 RepID=UPI001C8EDAB5|nr:hypothetical protein [Bathymodiolus japonicus methanotrophic gill symbiont]